MHEEFIHTTMRSAKENVYELQKKLLKKQKD